MDDILSKFIVLCDVGSFSKAGEVLHISQPALSTAIKKLEKSLKQTLLTRSKSGVQPTDAGLLVYQTAKNIDQELDSLKNRLKALENKQPQIVIGAIDSIAELLVDKGINVNTLSITVDNSSRLIDALVRGQVDSCFVTVQHSLPKNVVAQLVFNEPFSLVCHPARLEQVEHTLKASKNIDNFLNYNRKSTTHGLIKAFAKEQSITLSSSFTSTSPDLIKKLVLQNQGVALLPDSMVEQEVKNKRLARVVGLSFFRPIQNLHMIGSDQSSDIDSIVKKLQKPKIA